MLPSGDEQDVTGSAATGTVAAAAPAVDPQARFAAYVATLGRGPGRSRSLTRTEARDAFRIVLDGAADPHQVGAFTMLLRYRGEDADEIAGLVEAATGAFGDAGGIPARCDLDWPSYGSGKTRGAPWFLLAALALADHGTRVLMHGTNEFTGGITVERALAALGRAVAGSRAEAAALLERDRFAYLPIAALSPPIAALLNLRRLLGLRSPVNTVGRLLDPAGAGVSVDGVFHPPYIDVHLGTAARLDRQRLVVLKGGGGEAERGAAKPVAVHIHDRAHGRSEMLLPALAPGIANTPATDTTELLAAVWRGDAAPEAPVATVIGTIALGLHARRAGLDPADADGQAAAIWAARVRR